MENYILKSDETVLYRGSVVVMPDGKSEAKNVKKADLLLIDLDTPMMVADHNLLSNIVYAADSSCVDTVICNGKVLMQNRIVPGEKEIIAQARSAAAGLLK